MTKSKRGKTKTLAKKRAGPSTSKMGKRTAKSNNRRTKTLPNKVARGSATRKARARKQKQLLTPAPQVETDILDIVEEPVPGILTITEIETVRVTVPDSAEGTKTGNLPPEQDGMAA